jgi:hypothetical protein
MTSPALSLQSAMRDRLLLHTPLLTLLGGQHIFEETPRGAQEPYVAFNAIETRDWSVQTLKAHEHFVTLDIRTKSRSRALAQNIVSEIETVLDTASLTLAGHTLINLRLVFWSVARDKSTDNFNAVMRFRAATEPL